MLQLFEMHLRKGRMAKRTVFFVAMTDFNYTISSCGSWVILFGLSK